MGWELTTARRKARLIASLKAVRRSRQCYGAALLSAEPSAPSAVSAGPGKYRADAAASGRRLAAAGRPVSRTTLSAQSPDRRLRGAVKSPGLLRLAPAKPRSVSIS